jgi:hypothetical protein
VLVVCCRCKDTEVSNTRVAAVHIKLGCMHPGATSVPSLASCLPLPKLSKQHHKRSFTNRSLSPGLAAALLG